MDAPVQVCIAFVFRYFQYVLLFVVVPFCIMSQKTVNMAFEGDGGCAMAQVVSHWPLTMDAQVRNQVSPCGICRELSGTGAGFCPSSSVFPVSMIPLGLQIHISWGG
jgi:hypothetical protein